jgi:gamma-glutamyltranspeptidase/glutathione hydrolase
VATANGFATEAAARVLEEGGSAVDAAITAALVLGVADPYNSGLGGGGFAVIFDKASGRTRSFDFRERAPTALEPARVEAAVGADSSTLRNGARSVAVPAEWAGLLTLHKTYGKLPLPRLARPAVERARAGFPVDAGYVVRCYARIGALRSDAEARRIFLGTLGLCPAVGKLVVQTDLARTMEMLADRGDSAAWSDLVAKRMVDSVAGDGGWMTAPDAADPIVTEREPVTGTFHGYRIVSMAPPSSGGTIVVSLLQAYERERQRLPTANRNHLWLEAARMSYYDRAFELGDPDFVEAPWKKLTSPEYADAQAARVDATANLPLMGTSAGEQGKHTTHLSVVDSSGNAVAMTLSINLPFGSGEVVPGTGVLLNDEMDDFYAGRANAYKLEGNDKNAPRGGKRPLSSMSPTLVFDDAGVFLVVGSPGGSQIPTAVATVIKNIVEDGLDPGAAVHAGRMHHQWRPDKIEYDGDLPSDLPPEVRKAASRSMFPVGNVQLIARTPGGLRAVSDCRGAGKSWAKAMEPK